MIRQIASISAIVHPNGVVLWCGVCHMDIAACRLDIPDFGHGFDKVCGHTKRNGCNSLYILIILVPFFVYFVFFGFVSHIFLNGGCLDDVSLFGRC